MSGFVLFSSLESNALLPDGDGIGSTTICGKTFESKEEAMAYAANLIRLHGDLNEIDPTWDDELLLLEFTDGLNSTEYFHVYELVNE